MMFIVVILLLMGRRIPKHPDPQTGGRMWRSGMWAAVRTVRRTVGQSVGRAGADSPVAVNSH